MLLACCFREPKPKHEKKNKTKNGKKLHAAASDEEAYVLTKSLISAPMGTTGSSAVKEVEAAGEFDIQTTTGASRTKRQISRGKSRGESRDQGSDSGPPTPTAERPDGLARTRVKALVQEEAGNTPARAKEEASKQRSSALKPPMGRSASTPVSKDPSHAQICSPNFTNISAIKRKEEVKDVRRMLATPEDLDESYISLSKINHVSSSTNSSKESPEKPADNEGPRNDNLTFTKKEKNDEDSHIKQSRENQDLKQAIEEQKRRFELQEKAINALKHEYESQIERLKKEHNSRMQEEKNNFHIKMLEDKEKHRKEVESAKIIAKNSANETISELNKQIVSERAKMFSEQQETKKRMEEEFRMKEARLEQSLACLEESVTMVEKREGEWQQEKEDILAEVQRLKAEASKMVSILAAEYEEENLSEEKKRSLSAEVYSLQLVVEMRTAEVRSLREKLATASQQLEDAAVTRNSLQKADAKIEDLKEQLREKIQHERNLSTQNMELQLENRNSAREADRMSKDVEQLQWRIRNNFELPVEQRVSPLASPSDPVKCLRNSYIGVTEKQNLLRSPKLVNKITHQNVINANNNSPSKRSLFTVSDEMIEATTTSDKLGCKSEPSDLSPCSDYTDDSIEIGDEKESDQRSINNEIEELDHDADSLDEGVGDVSSDGEPQLSPVDIVDKSSLTTNSSLETVVTNVQEVRVITTQASEEEEVELRRDKRSQEPEAKSGFSTSPRLSSSPVKERIPSRYSFNNI